MRDTKLKKFMKNPRRKFSQSSQQQTRSDSITMIKAPAMKKALQEYESNNWESQLTKE